MMSILIFFMVLIQPSAVHLVGRGKFVYIFYFLSSETRKSMDLSPFRQNFEKNRNRQKYHHSLKEHPTFTKIANFGCEML